ncbi:hypothetical protein [Glycomyces salinus]|uniref:hypothetical protein n=1 Tax=Glycomyces salinus TaxID=980294 RepID=UPI0018ECFBAA|nr:hypothetical protein [Glycomyces salinus]
MALPGIAHRMAERGTMPEHDNNEDERIGLERRPPPQGSTASGASDGPVAGERA